MNKQTKIKHTTSVPSLQHIDMKTPSLQQPVLLQMQHLSYIRALFGSTLCGAPSSKVEKLGATQQKPEAVKA